MKYTQADIWSGKLRSGTIILDRRHNISTRVLKVTPKTVTILGTGYKGYKRFTYRWDGKGFKRQGQYLHQDGVY